MIMPKRTVALFLVVAIVGILALTPAPAHAFNLSKVISVVVNLVKALKSAQQNTAHFFHFGGHITHSEGGCSLKFRVWVWITVFGIPIPVPGPAIIPLGGNTITVGPPIPGPGQMFTFPFISDVYQNHHEGRVGPWALGIGFTPFPIDQINKALNKITIPPNVTCPGAPYNPEICLDNFHLDCSDNNKNIILKLGTS